MMSFVTTHFQHYVQTKALWSDWEQLTPDEQVNYETIIVTEHMKHWGMFVEVKRQRDGDILGWYSIGNRSDRWKS